MRGDVGAGLERLTLVRTGEWGAAAWSAAYFFCVLASYYLLRPVREAFGIAGGADKLPWLMTGTMLAMLAVNPAFAALVSRLPRRRFIPLVHRFFGANLLAFAGLFLWLPEPARLGLGYAFYIWLSVFNLFVVSVFWAFMADVHGHERGKRLFGVVAVGGTLGAIVGLSVLTGLAQGVSLPRVGTVRLTPPWLMLVALLPLEAAVYFVRRLSPLLPTQEAKEDWRCGPCGYDRAGVPELDGQRRCPECGSDGPARPVRRGGEPGPSPWEGLRLIARSPYLLLICAYMFLFTTCGTLLYMEQGRIVEQAFGDRQARVAAFARIDLWVNVLTLATQLFLTARVIRAVGVGGTLTVLPLIFIGGFAALLANPTFAVLAAFQVLRRGLHYALDRPARELLFAILGPDEKYKSKPFIDTFVYRTGDMVGGWTPLLLAWMGIATPVLALPVAAAWLACGGALGASHRRLTRILSTR